MSPNDDVYSLSFSALQRAAELLTVTSPKKRFSSPSHLTDSFSPFTHVHYKKLLVQKWFEPNYTRRIVPNLNQLTNSSSNRALDLSSKKRSTKACYSDSESGSFDSGFTEPLDLSAAKKLAKLAISKKDEKSKQAFVACDESNFGRTKFICGDCGKNYKSASQYRAHVRRHESKQTGRYSCSICNKNFVQRSSLKTHERIHTGEKPYLCNLCDERFGDFSTFTKHRRTHTGEKPYDCPVCKRAFSQSGNMHRHLKVVHKNEYNLFSDQID